MSKRTLQRFRSSGELIFQAIYHKTYYRESDVEAFMKLNFEKRYKGGYELSEDMDSNPEERDVP